MSQSDEIIKIDASHNRRRREDFDLSKFPALQAWMTRTGAVALNFRKFAVKKDEGGYPRHVATARIKDGAFLFDGDAAHAPTEEEKAAIESELKASKFPESIAASRAEAEHHASSLDGDVFFFLDPNEPKDKQVLFVEQRIHKDGEKIVLPWSFWNDGRWRMMEPDGLLPLWGLNRVKHAYKVFIHEGAAAARFVQALVDKGGAELAAHPWAEDLRDAAHLGWPGGVKRARAVDWETIKKLLKNKRAILICDNDQGGVDAARTISSILKLPLSFVRFGDGFRTGFDLGDDFAKETKLWEEKKGRLTWVGPSFEDCLSPATWATQVHEPEGKGRPSISLRKEFANEWMFSVKPMKFVNRLTMRSYAQDEFNVLIAPFSDAADVAERLHKWPASAAETMAYEPGKASGLIPTGRGMVINMYRPSDVKPVEGDARPFHEFTEHLIPNEQDRAELLRWCATLIARPSVRMHYSVLLISEMQGVGKTTLAEKIMMPLIGNLNCSAPTAHEATNPQFTSWLMYKRLAVIGEIYDGESSKAYNRLKTVLTDPWVRANEKYEKPYDIPNWTHVMACSNSLRALKLADNDRRWFVPEVAEEKWPHQKWVEFNTWLGNGGLEAICFWAHDYVKRRGHVQPGIEAPEFITKQRSVVAAMSDGEKLVYDLGTSLAELKKQHVVRLDWIRTWLAEEKSGRRYGYDGSKYLETAETIARKLKLAGLKICKRRFKEQGKQFQVAANFEVGEEETWETLKTKCIEPFRVYLLAEKEAEEKEAELRGQVHVEG